MGVLAEVDGGEEPDDRSYPWLGVNAGLIVLFSRKGEGTVVTCAEDHPGVGFRIGDYAEDWDHDMFEEFTGSVTLANDGCIGVPFHDEEEDAE